MMDPGTTMATLERSVEHARRSHILHMVVASCTGATALTLLSLIDKEYADSDPSRPKVCCVSHANGSHEPGQQEMYADARAELQDRGVPVLTATHLMGGIERAVTNKYGGLYPAGIVANTLRLFGQGTKVAVECSVMSLDAGLIPYGEDVIAIGGTGRGADTALVIRPSHANSFFDTQIKDFIVKSVEV